MGSLIRGPLLVTAAGLVVLAAGVGFAQHAAQVEGPDDDAIIAELRASIPRLMAEEQVPGLALALVDDRAVLWSEGFGFTDDDNAVAVTPQTLFSIQSMSKTFTATAVLLAVQDGLVDLDTPIRAYLPGFAVHSRFEPHPEERITLRHLLSHTAGFTHEAPVGNNFDPRQPSFARHVESISQTWLRFPVGQRYAYSNLGIDLAGWILEVRSGQRFADYVKHRLLNPVGMEASTLDPAVVRDTAGRAVGHSAFDASIPSDIPMVAAGGLWTTAADLSRFLMMQLDGGRVAGTPLLSEALLHEMRTIPFALPGQKEGYGLGIAIGRRHGRALLSHGGGGFGFLSEMIWYPDQRLGIVMLTNSTTHSFQWRLPSRILDRFVEARLGPPGAEPEPVSAAAPQPVEIPAQRLDDLAGEYLDSSGEPKTLAVRNDTLGIVSGRQLLPFTFLKEDEAVVTEWGEARTYRFLPAADGQPAPLISVNDGELLDRNVGPRDPAGPGTPHWNRWVGRYRYEVLGRRAGQVEVHRRNGYLFLDRMKLAETEPGLFFTPTGEALDLRGPTLTWRSVRVERIEVPLALRVLLVASQLLFLSALVGWPVAWVGRRWRARATASHSRSAGALRPARWVAGAVAALDLVLLFGLQRGLAFLIGQGLHWTPRLPLLPRAGSFAFSLAAGLGLLPPVFAIVAFRRGAWSPLERVHYALVAMAAVAVAAVLVAWRLVP